MKSKYFAAFNKIKTSTSSQKMIQKLFKIFKIQSRLTRSSIQKVRGHSIISMLYLLFIINLEQDRSIFSGLRKLSLEKMIDPILDMMNNLKYDWKGFLYRIGKVFEKEQASSDCDKMIIFDDTSNIKTGKKVDFIAWFYDHAKDGFYKGYQTVMAAYYNGFQSIPLSFQFKIGNYRKYDSRNIRKYKKASKMRGIARYAKKKKLRIVIQMIKQIMQRRFDFSYILWDSWYTYTEGVKFVFARLIKRDIHLISMIKQDNRYYRFKNRPIQYHQLLCKADRDWTHISESDVKFKEIVVDYLDSSQEVKIDDRPSLGKVKLVFVKYPNVEKYRILMSTNVQLQGLEILEKYLFRWSIELLFKNMKQYFGYNQCMSGKYEVLVADFSIRCAFYIMLAYRREYFKEKSMREVILDFYKELYENTLRKLIDKILYTNVVKILDYAIEKGYAKIKNLKNNLNFVFDELFRYPTNKIVPD